MISVAQFVSQYNGLFVKSPHGISGQCVSVPSEFAVLNGWGELWGPNDGTAELIWQNGVPGYQKVVNTPTNMPSPGDFVFFSYNHVVLVISATATEIVAFEQNDTLGTPAHTKTYSYTDVQGWFHYPQAAVAGVAEAVNPAYVRAAATTSAALAGSQELQAGQTFDFQAVVNGQLVTENGITSGLWYESTQGHYVWSGNCKTL